MEEIWIAMLFFCIGWHFYYQRKLAESARRYIEKYCEENTLQFMSIAKLKARLVIDKKRGIQWENNYHFEFSGDGESSYEGTLTLLGTKVKNIDLPVYRVS